MPVAPDAGPRVQRKPGWAHPDPKSHLWAKAVEEDSQSQPVGWADPVGLPHSQANLRIQGSHTDTAATRLLGFCVSTAVDQEKHQEGEPCSKHSHPPSPPGMATFSPNFTSRQAGEQRPQEAPEGALRGWNSYPSLPHEKIPQLPT